MSKSGDIISRVYALLDGAGTLGTIQRGNVQVFNQSELPSCVVFTVSAEVHDSHGDRAEIGMDLGIRAYVEYSSHPEDEIDTLVDAVRAAVEVDDATLAGLLSRFDRLKLTGYDSIYPESAGGVVGVEFSYLAVFQTNFGGSD